MVENVGEDRGENPWNIPQGNVSETAEKRLLAKPMQSLREAYGYSMISHQVRHLELSTDKVTKNVRETSDMVVCHVGQRMALFVNETNKKYENLILHEERIFVIERFSLTKKHRMNRMRQKFVIFVSFDDRQ